MTAEVRLLRLDDGHDATEIAARCYPFLDPALRFQESDVDDHVRVFPEGAFAAVVDGRLAGFAVGWLMNFDLDDPGHRLEDVMESDQHDPSGDWYYGLDIAVDPEFRGRGIGGMLYEARKDLVRRLGKRGIVAGGMIPGYRAVQHDMTPFEYVAQVVTGERQDPTLSFQLANGFAVHGLLPRYVDGTAGRGMATLLVWEA